MTNRPVRQSFLSKFLQGGAWAVFVRSFTALSNFAISMIIARLLDPDQVGIYFLMVSFVSVAVSFSLLGLDVAIVKIIAKSVALEERGVIRQAILKSRKISLVSSFVVALILYFIGLEFLAVHVFKSGAIYDHRVLIATWLILWSLASLNAEFFRGFKQFHLAVLFKRLAANAIILVISSIVFITGIEIELSHYLNIVLLAWFLSVLISSFLLQRLFLKNEENEHVGIKYLLTLSMPLWFTSWIGLALPQMDLWIVAVYEPPELVALYGMAMRLIVIVTMPLLIIQSVVPPLIAETYSKGEYKDLSKGLQTVTALVFIPGFALCIVYLFAGDFILELVYGSFYVDAFLVLKILTIGAIFRLFAASSQSLLTMTGFGKTAMTISIVSGLTMVFGAIYAGKLYGMKGVAVAAAVALALDNLLNLLFARFHTGIWVYPMVQRAQIRRILKSK